jgi:DNA-binding transcriptional regulator/RsmH inhibitor MraZ
MQSILIIKKQPDFKHIKQMLDRFDQTQDQEKLSFELLVHEMAHTSLDTNFESLLS